MDFNIDTWLNLLIRWFHVMAGIMWIGTSFYFVALDNSLKAQPEGEEGDVGDAWLFHGGGYYHVKKSIIAKESILQRLQWYKWESYLTWISGFSLLCVVYFWHAGLYMVDPSVADISATQAIGIGIGTIVVGWLVYDRLWRILGPTKPKIAMVISLILYVGVVYMLTHLLSGRASFIMSGALLGTIMAGNVALVIMPNQRKMYASHRRGEKGDPSFSYVAKRRSTHNNYMTLPVIFMMISNHFAMTYGASFNWLVLIGMFIIGMGANHFMNSRETGQTASGFIALAVALLALIAIAFHVATPAPVSVTTAPTTAGATATTTVQPVAFATVKGIITERCEVCHSKTPTSKLFSAAPMGIKFDTALEIQKMAPKIKAFAVDSQVMPLGNMTKMTTQERQTLGTWIAQGANINAK